MALPPGRPPDDCRRRHEKPPVTAPSHKSPSSYDLPACQNPENLVEIAAFELKVEPDTVNRRAEPEKLAEELDAKNQRGPKTVTENDDRETRRQHEFELIMAKTKKDLASLTRSQASSLLKGKETSERFEKLYAEIMLGKEQNGIEETKLPTTPPNPTSPPALIHTPNAPESCPERPEHEIETRINRPEIPAPRPISQIENPSAREENTSISAPETTAPGAVMPLMSRDMMPMEASVTMPNKETSENLGLRVSDPTDTTTAGDRKFTKFELKLSSICLEIPARGNIFQTINPCTRENKDIREANQKEESTNKLTFDDRNKCTVGNEIVEKPADLTPLSFENFIFDARKKFTVGKETKQVPNSRGNNIQSSSGSPKRRDSKSTLKKNKTSMAGNESIEIFTIGKETITPIINNNARESRTKKRRKYASGGEGRDAYGGE
mmetsp:Transcript_40804/g.79856  ORF Transcript_40804/g.79856 Transcript_40804/m.79856 type:complete len:438 (-) Transcript_40804:1395-2708(-)